VAIKTSPSKQIAIAKTIELQSFKPVLSGSLPSQ